MSKTYQGTVFEVPSRRVLTAIRNALVCVNANGVIEKVLDPERDAAGYLSELLKAQQSGSLVTLAKDQYLLPGLIDLHIHAPQWPQMGKALDRSLESWLMECTFPLEAKYADIGFASKSYNSLVSTLLANGTTTGVYFASVHLESSVLLAKICLKKGQRAVVGRVGMDLPEQCPEYYRDPSPQESVALSEAFITQVKEMEGNTAGLVLPAVVPRFIPTCSDEALRGFGELVKKYGCHVETHCSESDWEHNHVIQRCGMHDAFALDSFGLMTRRTVLAHSNFISDADMDLIKERGAGVAHCPFSNYFFSNAVFPLQKALEKGVHVGMGTDISGGPSASLFDVCRFGVCSSISLEHGVDPTLSAADRSKQSGVRVDHLDAFYVASTKGGEALDLKIGRIAPGYFFDAIVVDTTRPNSNLCIFDEVDSLEDVFQKIMYNANPSNIVQTYVNGRLVHEVK